MASIFPPKGYAIVGGFLAYMWFIQQSYTGPTGPKFRIAPELAPYFTEAQPGIDIQHYVDKKIKSL